MAAATARRVTRTPRTEPPPDAQGAWDVTPDAAATARAALLSPDEHNDPTKPYCTCSQSYDGKKFTPPTIQRFLFDPKMGVYVHGDPSCWRPSKGYYQASREVGVLDAPRTRGEEPPKTARRVTRTPRT